MSEGRVSHSSPRLIAQFNLRVQLIESTSRQVVVFITRPVGGCNWWASIVKRQTGRLTQTPREGKKERKKLIIVSTNMTGTTLVRVSRIIYVFPFPASRLVWVARSLYLTPSHSIPLSHSLSQGSIIVFDKLIYNLFCSTRPSHPKQTSVWCVPTQTTTICVLVNYNLHF